MSLPYASIRDTYDTLRRAGVVSSSLADWANEMNQRTGTNTYGAAVNDNWIKRASYGIDQMLAATGLPDWSEGVGREVGAWVGDAAAGAEVGRSLPRAAVNFAPLGLAAVPIPGAAAVGLGLSGALAGAESYTATDSPLSGLIAGGVTAAMPGIARLGEQGVLRLLQGQSGRISGPIMQTLRDGTKRFSNINEYLPRNYVQGGLSQLGGEAAASVAGEGQRMLEAGLSDEVDYEFSPTRALLEMTLGQAPFAAIYTTTRGREALGGRTTQARRTMLEEQIARTQEHLQNEKAKADAKAELDSLPPVAKPPPETNPLVTAKTERLLSDLRARMVSNAEQIDALKVEATPDAIAKAEELERIDELVRAEADYQEAVAKGDASLYGEPFAAVRARRKARGDEDLQPLLPEGEPVEPDLVIQRSIAAARRKMETATTMKDYAEAVDMANAGLEQLGEYKIQRSIIEAKRKELEGNAEPPTEKEVVTAVLNDAERKGKRLSKKKRLQTLRQQERDAASEYVRAQQEEAANQLDEAGEVGAQADTELVAEVNDLKGLTEAVGNRGVNGDRMVTSGELNRLYKEWVDGGRVGGFDALRQRVLMRTAEGKGVPKKEPKVELPPDDEKKVAVAKVDPVVRELTADEIVEQAQYVQDFEVRDEIMYLVEQGDLKKAKELLESEGGDSEALLGAPAPGNVGDGFTWSLADYSAINNKLGKHTLPKSGMLKVSQFKNMANREGRGAVPDAEIDMMRELVPEAFEGESVNVPKLMQGLEERGPVVEIKKLGEGQGAQKITEQTAEQAIHITDTAGLTVEVDSVTDANGNPVDITTYSPEVQAAVRTLQTSETGLEAGNAARYSFLGPKSVQDMPGYVEGLVRLSNVNKDLGGGYSTDTLYTGPHFGAEDKNVLAFFRGYEETLPDGTKAFHVIEVQSDWAQQNRDYRERLKETGENTPAGRGVLAELKSADSPLLRSYESLALKAAINHAKEIGATKIILSDGETAMMTEGHDKVFKEQLAIVPRDNGDHEVYRVFSPTGNHYWDFANIEEAKAFVANPQPDQAAGMRLHYDQTLPSALKKLTGEKGERVELGVHKAALSEQGYGEAQDWILESPIDGTRQSVTGPTDPTIQEFVNRYPLTSIEQPNDPLRGYIVRQKNVVGSPVFRNPDGTPKSSITGLAFDISSLPQRDAQGGFTLGGRAAAPGAPKTVPTTRFIPLTEADKIWTTEITDNGNAALMRLLASADATIQHVAKTLAKFPDVIARARLEVVNGRSEAVIIPGQLPLIRISADLRKSAPNVVDAIIAHELTHAVTLEQMSRPEGRVHLEALTKLRQELVGKLEKNAKKVYDKAVATNWMERYVNKQATWGELFNKTGLSKADQNIIYGLLNNEEFVAQGFSSDAMIDFMASNKSAGKIPYVQEFVNWVKKILNITDATAFDTFMRHTEGLLKGANEVASVRNYADLYLQNQGIDSRLAMAQTERVAGLIPTIQLEGLEGVSLLEFVGNYESLSGNLAKTKRNLAKLLTANPAVDPDLQMTGKVLDTLGFRLDQTGIDDFANAVMAGEFGTADAAFMLLPEAVTDYISAKYQDTYQVLNATAAATRKEVAEVLEIKNVDGVHQAVRNVLQSMKGIKSHINFINEAKTQVLDLSTLMGPDGFMDNAVVPGPAAEVIEGATPNAQSKVGEWIERFLKTPAVYARNNPALAEFFDKGYQLQQNARKFHTESVNILGKDLQTGEASHDAVMESNKVFTNKKLLGVVNKWLAEDQLVAKTEQRGVTTLMSDHPKIAPLLKTLTPEERRMVGNMVARAEAMTTSVHALSLEKMQQIAGTRGAAIVMRDGEGRTVQDSVKLSNAVFEGIMTDRNDPAAAARADQLLAWARGEMSGEGFLKLLEFHKDSATIYSDMATFFNDNKAWVSARRSERFQVRAIVNNKPKLWSASSRKEAMALVKEAGGKLVSIEPTHKGGDDAFPELGIDASGVFARLEELEDRQIKMLESTGAYTPEQIAEIREKSAILQFGREAGAHQKVAGFTPPPRLLSQGAEDLPFMWNHMSWAERQANYWTRALFRAEADLHLLDPSIMKDEKLRGLVKTHRDNLLQQDPELARKLSRFTTTWFMGFAPASAMVNATQAFVTHVAEFTSMTGNPIDSYRRVAGAFGKLIDYYKGGRKWADPDVEWFMGKATEDGERSYSMYDDEAAINESIATNTKRQMLKAKVQTLGQRAGRFTNGLQNASMMMFKGIERINADAALLAGFEYYRQQGMPREQAREMAYRFNHTVNFTGGRANRPIGAFSGRGDTLRTAAMFSFALQSYVLGTTWNLAGYLKRGFFQPQGLTAHEKWKARNAAIQMLGTQFAMAGALGLPFVSGAIAILEQAFPDLEINKNMREALAQLFGEDEEDGSTLQDIAMTGIPSMMGWDLQSRLSMGNTLPGTSEINGFQPEQLAGPLPNLIGDFVMGGTKALQGQAPWEFVPPGVRKLAKTITGGGELKDWKGRSTIGRLTPTEQVGAGLGFNPKRLSNLNAASRMTQRAEDIENRREGQWRQQQATEVLNGNFGTVRQSLQQRAMEDKDFDVREAVRSIVRAAEELSFPRDLRNEGGSRRDAKVLGLFNLAQSGPTESQRLQFRTEISRRIGLPMNLSNRDLQMAQLMDQLRIQRPNATRSELRRAAEVALRGSSTPAVILD